MEPSLTQLAAMAREDPDALASVANFKIGRRGIGAVRWLTPTDVRSLNVEGTVALSRGSVEVRPWDLFSYSPWPFVLPTMFLAACILQLSSRLDKNCAAGVPG